MNDFGYLLLDDRQKASILEERLRVLEVDHFKTSLELRLARVAALGPNVTDPLQGKITALEVQASALRTFLGLEARPEEPAAEPEPAGKARAK